MAQWQPRRPGRLSLLSVPCRFLPWIPFPRDTRGHSDPTPVTSMWQELVTISDSHCSETGISLSAFFSRENRETGYLTWLPRGTWKKRGTGRYREHTLNPLFSSGLPLLISRGRKGMLTRVQVCTHTHTDVHTHPGSCPRIPCLPGIDERTPFSESTVPGAMWGGWEVHSREWLLSSGCLQTDTGTFHCKSSSCDNHYCGRDTGAPEAWASGH